MLRKEQNDLLTRTGAGTPMGQMFRRYWIPALLAEELPKNHCPPVRVRLLSEPQRLMRSALALENGEPRPGTDPATHHVRSVSVVLPRDAAFADAAREALTARPGVAPTSV